MLAAPLLAEQPERLPTFDDVCDDFGTSREAASAIERRALALAGSRGRRLARLCSICASLARGRGWERLGFARLRDYADERLGVSVREFQDWARVGRAIARAPALEAVLCAETLPWSKVRLLARLVDRHASSRPDLAAWIEAAKSLSCVELAEAVSRESAAESDAPRARRRVERVQLMLSPGTWAWWSRAAQLARRQAGAELSAGAILELAAAEWSSAHPLECPVEASTPLDAAAGLGEDPADADDAEAEREDSGPDAAPPAPRPDPFPLDERLRALLAAEQRRDAELGRWLGLLRQRLLHRDRGFDRFDVYARERFGIAPRKLQILLRIDRACAASLDLEHAYRRGALSWAQADLLVPVVQADPRGHWHASWVARASQVSVRRLRSDVSAATLLAHTDPEVFHQTGGLPDERDARLEREVHAHREGSSERDANLCVPFVFFAEPDLRALILATVFSAQRYLGRVRGAAVSLDLALRAIFQHACAAWGDADPVPREHRVFERDAWRCQMPGCSGRRNLHAHHVEFASHGGKTRDSNLVTLCAWHHLRGVHRGIVGVVGQAPDRLLFTLGRRSPGAPLAVFASGDRVVPAP